MGWPKSSFGCFYNILQENPKELFGQPVLYGITYMCNLKSNTNKCVEQNRNRLTYTENKPVVAVGKSKRRGQIRHMGLAIQTTQNR